jgi:hypothetical protein
VASRAGLNGLALAEIVSGVILAWSGIENQALAATFRSLVQGKAPTPGPAEAPGPAADGGAGTSPASTADFESSAAIEALWVSCGGNPQTAKIASQICMAESAGNPTATSPNPGGPGCVNAGLWQLATPCGVGAGHTEAELYNPVLNCRLTIEATNDGINWSDWDDPVANSLAGHQYVI